MDRESFLRGVIHGGADLSAAEAKELTAIIDELRKPKPQRGMFLWPVEDGSIEQCLFEMMNATTDDYAEEHYKALTELLRIRRGGGA